MNLIMKRALNLSCSSALQFQIRTIACSVSKSQWNEKSSQRNIIGNHFGVPGNALALDLQRFLEEIGADGREARFWLKTFQHRDANPERPFAVLQICTSVFERPEMLNKLGSSLAFLQRNGLTFILVHGINTGSIDRSKLLENTIQLTDVLERHGAKTRPLVNCSGVFRTNESTGDMLEVNINPLVWSLSSGHITILSSLAETRSGKMVHVCPIRAVDELSAHFKPMKVMYLNVEGGILNKHGKVIEQINLPTDYINSTNFWYDQKTHEQLGSINRLTKRLPFTSSVVITSADTVLKELFTHKGSGTIFKQRELLNVHSSFDSIDVGKLISLIERTFKKRVVDNYLGQIEKKLIAAYITDSYSAASIITKEEGVGDVPYLDKFAVSVQHQGLGSGETIWERMKQDFPKLFWRSKHSNLINPWYFGRSEGSWTSCDYVMFWYGVTEPKISHDIVNFGIEHPSSFVEQDHDQTENEIHENKGKRTARTV